MPCTVWDRGRPLEQPRLPRFLIARQSPIVVDAFRATQLGSFGLMPEVVELLPRSPAQDGDDSGSLLLSPIPLKVG